MTMIQSRSQISPVNERLFHQSNLLGDWKGSWTKNRQAVEFKVINIRGNQAEIEYTHNGRTERGLADVSGATITFGNVTIGTRNGSTAAIEFSVGGAKMTGFLGKQASTEEQSKLIGTWRGFSRDSGQAVSFQVVSVDGRDAQVKVTANGVTKQGTATVYKNTVMFGKAQISSDDGTHGKVILQVGHKTFAIPVTKVQPQAASTSVNRLA